MNNTTRQGDVPGGLGLSTLLQFLDLNKGSIQIISSKGYWIKHSQGTWTTEMSDALAGTIVNIEFNVNDKNSYILSNETEYSLYF